MSIDAYEEGLKIRKAVLGEEYVNRALASVNSFNAPLQQLVTEYCWGKVWGRPGLDRKQRSLLNLAMIGVLNRSHELKAHIRGAGVVGRQLAGGELGAFELFRRLFRLLVGLLDHQVECLLIGHVHGLQPHVQDRIGQDA